MTLSSLTQSSLVRNICHCDHASIDKTNINTEEFVLYHQISVYAVPEKIDQTAYALDAAVKLLDFYEDYFDIPYPLPKQGQWKYMSSSHHCSSR